MAQANSWTEVYYVGKSLGLRVSHPLVRIKQPKRYPTPPLSKADSPGLVLDAGLPEVPFAHDVTREHAGNTVEKVLAVERMGWIGVGDRDDDH